MCVFAIVVCFVKCFLIDLFMTDFVFEIDFVFFVF